ncbi:MAG: DnaD domain protein [Lachnospiraceae bacterium]|nr:DnaD domain protein [Lachnospiraceae bacterium]
MANVTLCKDYSSDVTILNNCFIDEYMCEANDAQIKIYLYLLRSLGMGSGLSVSDIADRFNYTEKDVIRALKYWDKKKVMSLSFNSSGNLTCIQLLDMKAGKREEDPVQMPTPVTVEVEVEDRIKMIDFSSKKSYTAQELASFKEKPEIAQLLYVAETYLGKTLRPDEITSILYMYDSYGFSADLIEYLIEYCANNKKKNIKYIESVADSWAATGISTVEEAKSRTRRIPGEVYEVFKAFGISGRNPVEPEISYVFKWMNVYGFTIDIICEACSRTIMAIHSPSFEYTDTILYNWKEAGVYSFDDIKKADALHSAAAVTKQSRKPQTSGKSAKQAGSFNDFSQRKYDYAQLEKDALSF